MRGVNFLPLAFNRGLDDCPFLCQDFTGLPWASAYFLITSDKHHRNRQQGFEQPCLFDCSSITVP